MKRREFIALIGGAAAAWPLAARTQGVNRPRVGYLFTSKKTEGQGLWEACRQGLRELGYREGENIILEPDFICREIFSVSNSPMSILCQQKPSPAAKCWSSIAVRSM